MGSLSIWHWLIVLVIVMLIFGTKKLRNIGTDLGGAVRGFKDGMREGSSDKAAADDLSTIVNLRKAPAAPRKLPARRSKAKCAARPSTRPERLPALMKGARCWAPF